MNWQSISFDWSHIRAFLATAEEGSLSAAARVLGQTQPTLGRQVTALEEELGVTLFERTGRALILTQPGAELLDHARAMRDAAMRVSLVASGQSQAIEGTVRITASEVYCAFVLPPVLLRLREIAPKLVVDLVSADDVRDLQQREADIAIRHVRPEQPDLIARLVAEATAGLYGAPSYLNRRGRPTSVEDLKTHDFVSFGQVPRMVEFFADQGVALQPENFRMGSASGVAAWAMVEQGLGLSLMADQVARRSTAVEQVVSDLQPVSFPVWLTTHRELHTARRIRLVFDLLADFLAQDVASSGVVKGAPPR
ncbi:LysR family transcriptional regulator [Phaeobacter gallaeciensis]|uniref:LysR family transcriptional regulator n=2 Tax=Roseobacteraceae TaxID=2854170 RepID=A0A366WWK9_9RHOB|nr:MULTISPECIES: LysR family transcriptional regulator [Roseobacteraceae]MBT3141145.1 LysR family transcriptional regulator [Falsiruegeria litorea]MBT8170856.1 LysR family transcriptional regulator [Falsiruegeria litorea]RBW54529.1 LysR family transcriptional regulator [Phaeobacter gallaeciensis]